MKPLLALLVLFSSYSTQAQTVSEKLGGVHCAFELYSDTTELDVRNQLLIGRANTESTYSSDDNSSSASALGYTEWHLEFVSRTKIGSRDRAYEERKNYRRHYHVQFTNSKGDIILSTYLGSDKIRLWAGESYTVPIYTYSIDLINLPLISLDDVEKMNIVFIR